MKKLILMRGLPGSGKSTEAKRIKDTYEVDKGIKTVIYSTDDFWGPDYEFDATRIAEAHAWNRGRVVASMALGVEAIIVDNTNCQLYEMREYVKFAEKFEYVIQVIEPITKVWKETVVAIVELQKSLKELKRLSKHDVPLDVLGKMAAGYCLNPSESDILNSVAPWEKINA